MPLIMTVSFLSISCSLKQNQKNEQLTIITTVHEKFPKTFVEQSMYPIKTRKQERSHL